MDFKQNFKTSLKRHFPGPVYSYLGNKNKYLGERNKIFKHLEIDVLFDVGANVGFYAHVVRNTGFNGKIVSFEPQKVAFNKMLRLSDNDDNWIVRNFGLGAENKITEINISSNSVSSSILENVSLLNQLCHEAEYTGKESIEIKRFDSIVDEFCSFEDNLFVKIDTQGYEYEVIEGCLGCLDRIKGFQLELSFMELYKGERTYLDMILYMKNLGFELVKIEPGWNDPLSGDAVEIDGIFVKK